VSRAIPIRSAGETLQGDLYGELPARRAVVLAVQVSLERVVFAPDPDRAAHASQFRK